jgi:hypothetical protein
VRAYLRHWYNIGLVIAIGVLVLLIGRWQMFDVLQRLLLLNFAVLLLHQFEEYGWPGGGPPLVNKAVRKGDRPDRYPLNQNNAMFINVICAYPFYLIPVFFPDVIWLGLAPVLFGLGQFAGHGVLVNLKIKALYNPGLFAVLMGHVPIGVAYLYVIYSGHLVTWWDWVFALAYIAVFIGFFMQTVGYGWLASKDSPYPFDDVEMRRFTIDARLARLAPSSSGTAGDQPAPNDRNA